jgi:glycerol-1-phosphate dehydrogenase [NAD(P)+]
MRGLEFGTPTDTHGIQCAVGTATAVKMYDKLRNFKPSKKDATDSVRAFSFDAWAKTLRAFLGKGAEAMIRAEEKDGKYSVEKHSSRIDRIIDGWDDILDIINTSLPTYSELLAILKSVGLPLTPEELGHDSDELALTLAATRDIRDKYVLSRLAWDIGATDYLLN